MPELPDLEVFSANIEERLAGKKLITVQVPNDKKLNVSSFIALKSACWGVLFNVYFFIKK